MEDVGFGLTEMAWIGGSRFGLTGLAWTGGRWVWTYLNGLDWHKSVLACRNRLLLEVHPVKIRQIPISDHKTN
jgi:hypothetical protein